MTGAAVRRCQGAARELECIAGPDLFSLSPVNVATPPAAFTVCVPPSTAEEPPGLLRMLIVTGPVKVVSTFPPESSAETATEKGLPATTLAGVGWVVTTS